MVDRHAHGGLPDLGTGMDGSANDTRIDHHDHLHRCRSLFTMVPLSHWLGRRQMTATSVRTGLGLASHSYGVEHRPCVAPHSVALTQAELSSLLDCHTQGSSSKRAPEPGGLMMPTHVAWVPDDDPQRPWDDAAGLAVDWIEDRCRQEQAGGLLVTNTLHDLGVGKVQAFGQRHSRVSRRSRPIGTGSGPVLAYVPDAEDLEFATRNARGSSLAVVATVAFPLLGWASWLGAMNLVTGEPTPEPTQDVKKLINRLVRNGDNGFGDSFGKQSARPILSDLRQAAVNDDFVLGAALAAGVSARGVGNLGRIMTKFGR